jgi:hypothetical protein
VFRRVAPTVAIAGLLRTMDVFARVIISCAAGIVLLGLVSMIMLANGVCRRSTGCFPLKAGSHEGSCVMIHSCVLRFLGRVAREDVAA